MDMGFTAFVFAVAILVAVGGSLLLVGYLGIVPASFNFGWKCWLPVLFLPVVGPLWFVRQHRSELSRAGHQLLAGVVLISIAACLLYWGGPVLIDQMANPRPKQN